MTKFSATQQLAATIHGIDRDVGQNPELLLTPQQQEELRAMSKQKQAQVQHPPVLDQVEIVDPETD